MANTNELIADILRKQFPDVDVSIATNRNTGWPTITAQLREVDTQITPEPRDDGEFYPDAAPLITAAITGKTVHKVTISDGGMEEYLTIVFMDGTALRFRYDYIYEWELTKNA